ncbi:MAG: TlyA family RNA methyltransferase [Oscillospiraceae bacterium]|nr:TlyA family RNA methyltransferase [Oscillospiraceae bacterium]
MSNKIRLDIYLTENGHALSRSAAQGIIMAGEVYINDQKADKAGQLVTGDEQIEVRSKSQKYVSRGGLKLEKALNVFDIDLNDKICMDIGASTGGFTDCMLKNGARQVFAVDVGYGQLAWSLRSDSRVINMERTNIRHVTPDQIGETIDFASIDVSFISLKLVLPVVFELLAETGQAVCLIKPQFEAGPENVGKKGVVRDKKVHKDVINNVILFTKSAGFDILGLNFSPIRGPEGNIEYLLWIAKSAMREECEIDVDAIVEASHEEGKP